MFELRLRAILRPRPLVVAKQRRDDLLGGPDVGVDRIHRRQGCHAAIARPFDLVEGRHTLRILFDQRHAFAIGRENQQLAFLFGRRRGQFIQEPLGLTSHASIDMFQRIHGNLLVQHRRQSLRGLPECLVHAEVLRELLEKIRGAPSRQAQPS